MLPGDNGIPERIPTPSFRRVQRPKQSSTGKPNHKEDLDDGAVYTRHRPLENAERRERKREEELLKYEQYIAKLHREYPELFR